MKIIPETKHCALHKTKLMPQVYSQSMLFALGSLKQNEEMLQETIHYKQSVKKKTMEPNK